FAQPLPGSDREDPGCPDTGSLGMMSAMTNPATSDGQGPVLAVDIQGVTKRFGPVTAVNDITLAIEPGEIVAFLGPNGAGKTTTVDMLLGLSRPDRGGVSVYGR